MTRSTAVMLAALLVFASAVCRAEPQKADRLADPDAAHPAVADRSLPPRGGHTYGAANVLDGRLDTAWCFRGDSANLDLYLGDAEARHAADGFALDLYPGYLRDTASLVENGAPREFIVTLSVGGRVVDDPLNVGASDDDRKEPWSPFRCAGVGPCKMTLRVPRGMKGPVLVNLGASDVRAGADSPDTCLSEVEPRFPASAPARMGIDKLHTQLFESALAERAHQPGKSAFLEHDGVGVVDWTLPFPEQAPCRTFSAVKTIGWNPVAKFEWQPGGKRVAPEEGEQDPDRSEEEQAFVTPSPVQSLRVSAALGDADRSATRFQVAVGAFCANGGAITWKCTEPGCEILYYDFPYDQRLPFPDLSFSEPPAGALASASHSDEARAQLVSWAQPWLGELRRVVSGACQRIRCSDEIRQVRDAVGTGALQFERVEEISSEEFRTGTSDQASLRAWRVVFRVGGGELDLMHSNATPRSDLLDDWVQIRERGQVVGEYRHYLHFDVPSECSLKAGHSELELTDERDDYPSSLWDTAAWKANPSVFRFSGPGLEDP